MDQGTLVENQIDDGLKLVELLAAAKFDVTAAWWVRTSEDGRWTLYIASKVVDESGTGDPYREVHRGLTTMSDPWISMSEIKVIGSTDPITKDVLAIQARHPGGMPTRSRKSRLGDLAIEEVYIYSPLSVAGDGRRGKRKTRIIGKREDFSSGERKIIGEEVGVVDGLLGEEAFNKGWLRLINAKFGGIEGFASRYPEGGYFQFME